MKVSVLIPNYNNEPYIASAIQSILNQSFKDFELIVVDDASTDNSVAIINSVNDPRLILKERVVNGGIVPTLNDAIALSKGQYLVRMDADDLCSKDRIELLVDYLDNHPEVGVVSSWLETFGNQSEVWKYPTDSDRLKSRLLFGTPLAHAPCAIRKEVLIRNNIQYQDNCPHCEDYVLFNDLSKVCAFGVIPKVLYKYRIHGENVTVKNSASFKNRFTKLNKKIVEGLIGKEITSKESLVHFSICRSEQGVLHTNSDIVLWVHKLRKINSKSNKFQIAINNELNLQLNKYMFVLADSAPLQSLVLSLRLGVFSGSLLKYTVLRILRRQHI